jgi:hypothetical protein
MGFQKIQQTFRRFNNHGRTNFGVRRSPLWIFLLFSVGAAMIYTTFDLNAIAVASSHPSIQAGEEAMLLPRRSGLSPTSSTLQKPEIIKNQTSQEQTSPLDSHIHPTIPSTMASTPKRITKLDIEVGTRDTVLGLFSPNSWHHDQQVRNHLTNLTLQPVSSLAPWPNVTTLAFYEGRFRSGYRNQMMAFTMVVFASQRQGHGQLLLPSVAQKDTYGTNRFIPFCKLWDVPHWNSHYPQLPRLVDYDPILHDQYNPNANPPWYRSNGHFENAQKTLLTNKPVRPHAFGKQHQLMGGYMHYAKGNGIHAASATVDSKRNPLEILMLRGALRPHPHLQSIIDHAIFKVLLSDDNRDNSSTTNSRNSTNKDYMTLHARVEPDMQRHPVCRDKKVLNLTEIFEFMETKWKDGPPVSKIFMPINRQYLEQEGTLRVVEDEEMTTGKKNKKKKKKKVNWIAVENLKALNHARDHGLWNGRVKVYEFGARSLEGTVYENKPSTPGAMLNFFIGIQAKIFIGTEVSSYSHDLLATRFFRGYTNENYKYLPVEGLVEWTPPHIKDPPGFNC